MKYVLPFAAVFLSALSAFATTWHADNGNETYTNPVFYDSVLVVKDGVLTAVTASEPLTSIPAVQFSKILSTKIPRTPNL